MRRDDYSMLVGPDEVLNLEQNAEVVVNGEEYYRKQWSEGMRDASVTWNTRDQHFATTCMRVNEHYTLYSTGPEPRFTLWAHNSHVGDSNGRGAKYAELKWNIGQMIRETFGKTQTLLVGLSTYTGTVTAAPKWGDNAHYYELNDGIPGSHEDALHTAAMEMPGQPNFGLFFRKPDGSEDEKQSALVAVMSEKRMDRCVGVKYNKEPQKEVEGHYRDVVMSAQFDVLLWVDTTKALRPIDMTHEWRAGELNPKLYS